MVQDAFKTAQDEPKTRQEAFKSRQDRQNDSQDASKTRFSMFWGARMKVWGAKVELCWHRNRIQERSYAKTA